MNNEIITVESLPSVIQEKAEKNLSEKLVNLSKIIKNNVKIQNNKFLYALNQIPIISHALRFEKGFKIIIPESIKKGLKDGSYKIMQGKDGSAISIIVDKDGKIVHQLRMEEFKKMANPAELSMAMNQMCMQMQLDEIQKSLSEFRLEVNSKLDEIIRNFHENRMTPAESLKLSFKRYQEGEIEKKDLLLKIDDAQASLFTDIKSQITSLAEYTTVKSINNKQNSDIQSKIGYILESIKKLQEVFFIECYLYKDEKNKYYEMIDSYTQNLIKTLSTDGLKLLNELTDFSELDLNYNVWEEKIIPHIKSLSNQYEESKFLLMEGVEK